MENTMENFENFLDTVVWGLILSEEYKSCADQYPNISQKIKTGRENLLQLINMLQSDNQLVDDVFDFIFNQWNNKPVQEIQKTISIFSFLDREQVSTHVLEKLHLLACTPGRQFHAFDPRPVGNPSSIQTTGGSFVNVAAVKCISYFYGSSINKNQAEEYLLSLLGNVERTVVSATLLGMKDISNPSPKLLYCVESLANEFRQGSDLLGVWGIPSR
jgi:hypothetical protein